MEAAKEKGSIQRQKADDVSSIHGQMSFAKEREGKRYHRLPPLYNRKKDVEFFCFEGENKAAGFIV